MDTTRGTPLKAVSIMWAAGVAEDEAQTAVATIKDLLKVIYDICLRNGVTLGPTAIRPFGTWVIPSIPPGEPYSGTSWYIDTAYDQALGQVVGPRFLDLVKREPWQTAHPHFDLAILDRDLTDVPEKTGTSARGGFVLASTLPGTATVVSVYRLRAITAESDRAAGLRRLIVHNFGHVLEIPADARVDAIDSSGGERHCTNLCAMRHAATAADVVRMAIEERDAGVVYCDTCRRDVLRSVLIQRTSRN